MPINVKATRNFCSYQASEMFYAGQIYDLTGMPEWFAADCTARGLFVYVSDRPEPKIPEGFKTMKTKADANKGNKRAGK